jgi:transcriptional regulator with XRE-family HTH domain
VALTKAEFLAKIGERIKSERLARQLTQGALAQLIETHQSVVSRIEFGDQNLTIGTLFRVAAALNVNAAELLPKDSA